MKQPKRTIKGLALTFLCFFGAWNVQAQECMFDWTTKVPITIDNSAGGELTDYQIQLTLDTETPIALGEMESDGSDIRFTVDGCCDPLCYYIESGINTATTVIWVKVPEIAAAGTEEIYMFFGNPDADAASDGACTFDLWAGFDGDSTGFEYLCGSISDSTVTGGNMNLSWTSNGLIGSSETFDFNEVYTVEAMVNSTSGTWPAIYWAKSVSKKNYGLMVNATQARISLTGGGTDWCSGHNWASSLHTYGSTAGLWSFTWIATGDLVADFPSVGAITTTNSLYAKDEDLRLMIGGISSGSGSINMDWLRVRKYAETPPTFSVGIPDAFEPAGPLDLGEDFTECAEATLDAGPEFDTYDWSTGGTEQTETIEVSGTYDVTAVDDEGCVQTDEITVTIAPEYALTETVDVCNGDSYEFPDGTVEENIESTVIHTSALTTEGFGCDSIIVTTVNVYEYSPELDVETEITSCDEEVTLDAGEGFGTYDWSSGGTDQTETVDMSGLYTIVVTDDNGCEQAAEINVDLIAINDGTSLDVFTITSLEADATSYQWLDCDDDYAVIDGATGISYEATDNGNYAVEITKGECVDTSACVNINGVSIEKNVLDDLFQIYPNPTTGQINLVFAELNESVLIRVTNVEGQLVQEIENNEKLLTIELEGADGLYFVEVISNEGSKVIKVVKK